MKYFFLSLALLMVITFSGGYYLLNTNSGLKKTISLVNIFSNYEIKVDVVKGRLLGRAKFENLTIKSKHFDFHSKYLRLSWQPKAIFSNSLVISSINLRNSVLKPKYFTKKEPKIKNKSFDLDDLKLPFNIKLESLLVENFAINGSDIQQKDFVIDMLKVKADYIDKIGEINTFILNGSGVNLNLEGRIETSRDFPLSLVNNIQYQSKIYGNENVKITIKGNLKKQLYLHIKGSGISDFSFKSKVISLLNKPQFDANFIMKKLAIRSSDFADISVTANISARGRFDKKQQIETKGKVFYDSLETDKIRLDFISHFDGKKININKLNLAFLTAKQQLTAAGIYNILDRNLKVDISSSMLQYPQVKPSLYAKDLRLNVSGSLDKYKLLLKTNINSQLAGNVPLHLQVDGSNHSVKKITATALVNGSPLDLIGKATWSPKLSYDFKITAPKILPIKKFPGIKGLNIKINGNNANYLAKGSMHLYANNIPPSDIDLNISGSSKDLEQAKLTVATLGGQAKIEAKGILSPLDITTRVYAKNIYPQKFYPQIIGNINGELSIKFRQINKMLSLVAKIEKLHGKLQEKPLLGKGTIIFNQADRQIKIDNMAINLAGNILNANGVIFSNNNKNSDFTAHIDAKQINLIVPNLSGSILVDVNLKGNALYPEIKGNINAKKIKYHQHLIKKVDADIYLSMQQDKVLVNAKASDIESRNNSIKAINLAIDGRVSRHQIRAYINEFNNTSALKVVGNGSFNSKKLMWSGLLQKFSLYNDLIGKWHLRKTTPLTFSANNIVVNSMCLQQKTSVLCADGKLQQRNGNFNLNIKKLETSDLTNLLPHNIKLNTTLNGSINVVLVNGNSNVSGKIIANGGRLKMKFNNDEESNEIKQLEGQLSLENNRLKFISTANIDNIGYFDIRGELPNIYQNKIKVKFKTDIDKPNFLQEFIPQLNNIKGNLNADVNLSGELGKDLDIAGRINLHKTSFSIPRLGLHIRSLNVDLLSSNNHVTLKAMGKSGRGYLEVNGNINVNNYKGIIDIKGRDFQVVKSRRMRVAVDPNLQITFTKAIKIRGDVILSDAMFIPSLSNAKITSSSDVVLPNTVNKKDKNNIPVDAEIGVKLGDSVKVVSADIETQLFGDIKLIAKSNDLPIANGMIFVRKGDITVYGQQLNIKHGKLIFSNSPITNPSLDMIATRKIKSKDITVGITALGQVRNPKISLFSNPHMPDSSILSYLLFGHPPDNNNFSKMALLHTGGLVAINTISRNIRSATGLDVLDISFDGLEAGKNLSKKLYVGVRSNFFNAVNQFLLKYKVSSKTHISAVAGNYGFSADLIKKIETD